MIKKTDKLLEKEKCVLWLAAHKDGWYRPYELERKEVEGKFIGSEADTRLSVDIFGHVGNEPQEVVVKILFSYYLPFMSRPVDASSPQ